MKMQGSAREIKNLTTSVKDSVEVLGATKNGYDLHLSVSVPLQKSLNRLDVETALLGLKLFLGSLPEETTTTLELDVLLHNPNTLPFVQNVQNTYKKLEALHEQGKELKSPIQKAIESKSP